MEVKNFIAKKIKARFTMMISNKSLLRKSLNKGEENENNKNL